MKNFLTVFCSTILSVNVAIAETRLITAKDLLQFKWISDPQLSQDGKHAAFVNITVNEKKTDYDTSIWRVSTDGGKVQPLTKGPRDTAPRWSPDGKYIAFLRAKEKDPAQLFITSAQGGEVWQLTKLPKGVSQPVWSKDGKTIAFLSTTNKKDLTADSNKVVTDVQVVTRAQYRSDAEGYLDFSRPKHIWTVAFSANKKNLAQPKQLTEGDFNETEIVWAPDGSKIYFTSDRDLEPYYQAPKRAIYFVPAAGGETVEVAQFKMSRFITGTALSVSPQGDRLAFLAVVEAKPLPSYQKIDVWILDLKSGASKKNLTANKDLGVADWIVADSAPPRAVSENNTVWSADGKSIVLIVSEKGLANLERINVETGENTPVSRGNHTVSSFSSNGTDFVARISSPTELNDLYFITEKNNAEPMRLTKVNEKFFSQIKLTPPLDFWYNSFDGKKIHALVQTPPDFDAHKKYPLILNIHGGPHVAYGYNFFHEIQWMAAKGYVVLYPNPRGSTTYGEAFANSIQFHYPGDDYKDLLAGVDALIKEGYIDDTRLGVTGGSGGGLLTNWAIGQTNRFKAAVSQRDIADFATWWYSSDVVFFQNDWFKAPPFVDAKEYSDRSPISFINKVNTPTMFVLGDNDTRTPSVAGGEQMFRELKYRKIPTVMIRFPGESHDLSRTGKPLHRVERLEHIVNWFDLYLQNKPTNQYDLIPPEVPQLKTSAD